MRFNPLKTLLYKANKPTKKPKTYSDTPEEKSPNAENGDYLTFAEIRHGCKTVKMKLAYFRQK